MARAILTLFFLFDLSFESDVSLTDYNMDVASDNKNLMLLCVLQPMPHKKTRAYDAVDVLS